MAKIRLRPRLCPGHRLDAPDTHGNVKPTSVAAIKSECAEKKQFQVPFSQLKGLIEGATTLHSLLLPWMNDLVAHGYKRLRPSTQSCSPLCPTATFVSSLRLDGRSSGTQHESRKSRN